MRNPVPIRTPIPIPIPILVGVRKELRLLRPGLLTALGLPVVAAIAVATGVLDWILDPAGTRRMVGGGPATADYIEVANVLLGVRFAIMNFAAAAFLGSEFENRAFERLLSEPVPRMRHWSLKMGVLAGSFAVVQAIDVGWFFLADWARVEAGCVFTFDPSVGSPVGPPSGYTIPHDVLEAIRWDACIHGWALCATTTATLFTRRTYTGFVAGMLAPVIFLMGLAWWWGAVTDHAMLRLPGFVFTSLEDSFRTLQWFAMAPFVALGAWRFRTMEVAGAA